MEIIPILLLGFFLGIKHATEADHLVAVTAIVSERNKVSSSSLVGVVWGLGHTLSVVALGSVIIYLKVVISEQTQTMLEFAVGLMIIALGLAGLRHAFVGHKSDTMPGRRRGIEKAFAVGMVHGLAGTAAVALLVLNAIDGVRMAVLYLLVFGAGTIIGMGMVATAVSLIYLFAKPSMRIHKGLIATTSVCSIGFGIYYSLAIL